MDLNIDMELLTDIIEIWSSAFLQYLYWYQKLLYNLGIIPRDRIKDSIKK